MSVIANDASAQLLDQVNQALAANTPLRIQGSGSKVKAKNEMNRKIPTMAPLEFSAVGLIKQAKVITKERPWPRKPIRYSLRRPTFSIIKKDGMVKRA